MEKRKAAANIFMEQQAAEMDDFLASEKEISESAKLSSPSFQTQGYTNDIKTPPQKKQRNIHFANIKSSEELQLEKEPIKVRITGFGIWKRVIVPPNAYVVHTRIGRKDPITIGLGVSFGYNPNKDAFMVVPAVMQTIGVVANCITKEKQGINILAYLQWQINNFAIAYKKLDFSELRDPLGIVNAQLREQAEAAIKDKIATMSVEEVLTDKAPVIEELTNRLKAVAEGKHSSDTQLSEQGLGIKIITVQIREAIVSSESLWTDLQSPFRNEQKKKARISFLETENEIKQKEFETKLLVETGQSKAELEIETLQQKKSTEVNEIQIREAAIRFAREQQNKQSEIQLQEQTRFREKESADRIAAKENEIRLNREVENIAIQSKIDAANKELRIKQMENESAIAEKESELNKLAEQHKIELEKMQLNAKIEQEAAEHAATLKMEQEQHLLNVSIDRWDAEIKKYLLEVENLKNNSVLFSELIEKLPAIAEKMPQASELKVFQSGNDDMMMNSLSGFVAKIMALGEMLGITFQKKDKDV